MADIRIKDLTTLESASLTGDVFVIDGTTGTRKLSAFSPTFGGNATVTGTLTVNGAGGSIGGQWKITNATIPDVWLQNTSGATSAYRNILIRQNSDDTFKFLSTSDAGVLSKDNILTGSNANGAIGIGVAPAAGASSLTVVGVIKTNDTTASTTTSTGALVVGNGTSGGLGVGGAIFAGDNVTIPNAKNFVVRDAAGSSTAIRMYADSSNYGYIDCTANTELRLQVGAGTKLSITNTGNVSIPATTASTTTSSGALVVSGGVGVAGAIYAGGNLGLANSSNILFGTDTSFYRSSAGALNVDHLGGTQPVLFLRENGSATASWFTTNGLCYFGTATAQPLIVRTNNTAALTITSAQKAEFASTIKTAAPSGGTAAEWKLGTVATVSPTSPNRTIEVDIGGTIYYLAAKTTNN